MKKTSFYTLPTVTKVSMAYEAAEPVVGGSHSTYREMAPPFLDFFLQDLYFLMFESLF